ncbi:MAG TPA: sulfurtransferase [Xanthomonadales bacterium]|nr:sulfurtransferase [Xanthomonadales bacterium]
MTAVPAIVSPQDAWAAIQSGALAVDVRADIADKPRGRREYDAGHVPGAVFADMETDLADLSRKGHGRHPLPDDAHFSRVVSRWGLTPDTHVIAYDFGSGAMAARLWWMLRTAGHARVSVMDGGMPAWRAAGLPVDANVPQRAATDYRVKLDRGQWRSSDEVVLLLANGEGVLVDARAANRFRGEDETIDPVGGHVPGAKNRPFTQNLDASGAKFKPAAQLRAEFQELLGPTPPREAVFMCGSGVTACHNLLALAHAGLGAGLLYADSWSGWISDPKRPIATGA